MKLRPATGRMTPERQKIREQASMAGRISKKRRRAPRASYAWVWNGASSLTCVFPAHPATTGRAFCGGCQRWLTKRRWTSEKGRSERRCDDCMRVAWRKWNEAARARVVETIGNVPKGWGFM